MTVRFQWRKAGDPDPGTPDWHQGAEAFEPVWEKCYDLLRFHKGDQFEVERRPDGNVNTMPLSQVGEFLEKQLKTHDLDAAYIVTSKGDGYKLAFRRHDVVDPAVVQLEQFLRGEIGEPYSLSAAGPDAYDCSGLTLAGVRMVTSIVLPHKAGSTSISSQLHDSRIKHITKAQLKPLDLLFHWGDSQECDHVSFYLDDQGPSGNGRVIDAEPHSTTAPAGWPTSTTGTGVRIRPMNPGYYCDWARVVAIGRVVEINGQP
jgi:cell wall-associated NlpC family hydrolase